MQDLRDHVQRQRVTFTDDFFKAAGSSTASSGSQQPTKPSENPADLTKKLNLEREAPKFGTAASKSLTTLMGEVQKGMNLAKKAASAVEATKVQLSDKRSFMLKSTLQFRMQLGMRWLGNEDSVVVLGKPREQQDEPAVAKEEPPPQPPVSSSQNPEVKVDNDKLAAHAAQPRLEPVDKAEATAAEVDDKLVTPQKKKLKLED